MKLSKVCSSAILLIAAGSAPVWVAAQQQPPFDPAPPPPRLEKLEETEAPSVTIQTPSEQKQKSITQTREQGRVNEVKVQSAGSTYTLRPRTIGSSVPGDAQNGPPVGPQWKIMEFDLGSKKKGATAAGEATVSDPAPPK